MTSHVDDGGSAARRIAVVLAAGLTPALLVGLALGFAEVRAHRYLDFGLHRLVLLTVAFHAIDPLATAVGAKRFGASRRAVVGAFVGTKLTLIFMMVGIAAVAFLFG